MKNPARKKQGPERTEELQGLGKCDPDFLNGDVVKDVGHRDAADSGNGENQIYEPGHVYRCCNTSKSAGQWKKKGRSDETNKPKTANRTELGGRTFNKHTVERPARRSDKSNQQPSNGNVARVGPRLKPKNTDGPSNPNNVPT